MEPPTKRHCLPRKRVVDGDLQQRRARNDGRLKSIFESIFDKYGKDFEGIGDEVDLMGSGEIMVDNGHLLGMANERDAGDEIDSSSEEFEIEYSTDGEEEEEDIHDSSHIEPGMVTMTAQAKAPALYPKSTTQSVLDKEMQAENSCCDTPSNTHGSGILEQIEEYESGEDELADKAVEWTTPREARAIAFQKWQLPQEGPTFVDEVASDPTWQAPLLPKSMSASNTMASYSPLPPKSTTGSSKIQRHEDITGASKSLWTVRWRKQMKDIAVETPSLNETPSALSPPSNPESSDGRENATNASKVSAPKRKRERWTKEEEERLLHLKATTDLTFRAMEEFFPKRNRVKINSKWRQLNHRENPATLMIGPVEFENSLLARLTPPRSDGTPVQTDSEEDKESHKLEHQLQTDAKGSDLNGYDSEVTGSGKKPLDLNSARETPINLKQPEVETGVLEVDDQYTKLIVEEIQFPSSRETMLSLQALGSRSRPISIDDPEVPPQATCCERVIQCDDVHNHITPPVPVSSRKSSQIGDGGDSAQDFAMEADTPVATPPMVQPAEVLVPSHVHGSPGEKVGDHSDDLPVPWKKEFAVRVMIPRFKPIDRFSGEKQLGDRSPRSISPTKSEERLEIADSQEGRSVELPGSMQSIALPFGATASTNVPDSPKVPEIPDSQSDSSSSGARDEPLVDLTVGEPEHSNITPSSALPMEEKAHQSTSRTDRPYGEYIDELSLGTRVQRKQNESPTKLPSTYPNSTEKTSNSCRPRENAGETFSKPTPAKLTATDLSDCSEDELSFM